MAENETTEGKKQSTKADLSKFETLSREYRNAGTPEARAKVIADNPDTMNQGILLTRRLEREALPMVTAALHRAEETTVGSLLIGTAIAGGLGVAGKVIYTGGKWVWNYFRPV